jgi:DNA-binding NtrC family response regulator
MANSIPILYVDDTDALGFASAISLEAAGFDVSQAYGGREAIDQCALRQFALAIVDLNMSDLDGPATIKELLALRPTLKIIAVSGGQFLPHFAKLSALGVHHFISKPIPLEILLQDMRDLLDSSIPMELSKKAA